MSQIQTLYMTSIEKLREILGDEKFRSIEKYLQIYNGKAESVKPVAKHVTIFWIGRTEDRMIIRTEGEDDIILSDIKDEAVPTIIFRKLKAVYLRDFMQLLRRHWELYATSIKSTLDDQAYNFHESCSLSPGLAGEKKGVMHGRCMKCPADILMGAVGGANYNLASRFVGDSAYALAPNYERRTGNAVDEVTYTTIMLKEGQQAESEEARTGALFAETLIEPGTLFVGKTVLFMPSPVELLYTLWLLTRTIRVGARTSIWGTFKITPVALVGDLFEVGSAYEAAERLFGEADEIKARQRLLDYVKSVLYAGAGIVEITDHIIAGIRNLNVLDGNLARELWLNAKNYVNAVKEYISASKR